MIFGAEEFVRPSPTNDDKPKSTEILPFLGRLGTLWLCLLSCAASAPLRREGIDGYPLRLLFREEGANKGGNAIYSPFGIFAEGRFFIGIKENLYDHC